MLNIHLYSLTSSSSSLFFTTIISVTCLFTGFLSLSPPSVSLQVSRPPAARILASDKASMLEFDLPRTQARKHANQAFKSLLCRTAQSPQKVQSTTKSAPKEEKGTDKMCWHLRRRTQLQLTQRKTNLQAGRGDSGRDMRFSSPTPVRNSPSKKQHEQRNSPLRRQYDWEPVSL